MSRTKDQYHDEIAEAGWYTEQTQDATMEALHDNYRPFASAVTEQLARSNAALLAASRKMREARKARLAVRFGTR